ncbi:Phenol hydroxylase, FAD- and (2Fe-2S)-containing reductase component DmpP [Cupriavidus necator H850]|jgi:phenol hydroxylase P5 protein|uniref:NADH:ubiquinone reductase (Na(+)-transporting) subunit F n=1 Tax=Cupriavidus TaxID=106589 RepID=UPI00129EB34A|nr:MULTISPECIES: phenol 2-monooxygenase domain-containing protein [Cupriavidus]KAI3601847.1 Phenol hydroxylase, FAD- and (2Fe-2S)-containing reductase component DmpP [Cupriavidus necator H850]QUN26449.1 2Fe-2S iron-sulfur cluster binding domain-containing protein [Cupriavidus sp. KK10]
MYSLTIEPIGQTIPIAPGQTVLDACLRNGVWLPHACCHGLCATCKVQVVDGEVEQGEASSFALMDFERDNGQCLACCATAQSDLVIEADIEEDADALGLPLADYRAEVVETRALTPTILGIWLRVKDGGRTAFQAGQYVNLTVPGCDQPRAFSLANAPGDELVELHVRRVPDGQATGYLHDQLAVGDELSFSAPYGRFFVRKSAQVPMLFLAGGSGLSSPRAMILDLLAAGETLPITLVQGARNRGELYYGAEFQALAQAHPNFRYVPALSDEPADSGWSGARGYVHDVLQQLYAQDGNADFRGHKAYLCGPPPMIEACIRTLMQGRLFEADIHTEKFLSAADAQNSARSPLFKI